MSVLGKGVPAAALAVGVMGLLFIGLTLKETIDDVLRPAKRWRRDSIKRQKERVFKRRKAFRAG